MKLYFEKYKHNCDFVRCRSILFIFSIRYTFVPFCFDFNNVENVCAFPPKKKKKKVENINIILNKSQYHIYMEKNILTSKKNY